MAALRRKLLPEVPRSLLLLWRVESQSPVDRVNWLETEIDWIELGSESDGLILRGNPTEESRSLGRAQKL